jgi:hypothetical protein
MTRCTADAFRVGAMYDDETWRTRPGYALDMPKKYELVEDKIPLPGGGFVKALRMALVDLSCFGEGRRLDLAGYPHENEAAALASDWAALGVDISRAAQKILPPAREGSRSGGDTEGSEATAERPGAARAGNERY